MPKTVSDSADELTDIDDYESETENVDSESFSKYIIATERAISLDETFVLALSSQSSGTSISVAAGLSNNTCDIFDVNNQNISKVQSLKNAHTQAITHVHINPETHICYTSSLDGFLKGWDLRTCDKPIFEFTDDSEKSENVVKPITCFDVSKDEKIICAGTEEVDGDCFLLFWDIRTKTLEGGYWESHTDDITQVLFHPTLNTTLMSGSTDGLVNIFDIKVKSEEDALINCLNIEDSVEKLCWLGPSELSCLTTTSNLQMWGLEETMPTNVFSRKQISTSAQMKSSAGCYQVNTHQYKGKQILITGSKHGKADCLRGLEIKKNKLKPCIQFIGNKQIVRCSTTHDELDVILTGGEAGIISIWKPSSVVTTTQTSTSKSKSSLKSSEKRKSKPYA